MEPLLPAAFVARMRALLGAEADAFLRSYDEPATVGVRANLLKLDPTRFRQIAPWSLETVPWCPSGFYVHDGERLGRHPYHAAGLYYVQEPSAMAVAEALDIVPGQRVIDLAAAPGGKTTHIAALLGNTGTLVANEVETSRIKGLGENLERWGARNVVLTNETVERLAARWAGRFDRVLLDAPCSGEGMFRKNAAARAQWSVEHVVGCAVRQERILTDAARLVKGGGRLVYSTCTFAPEEDEQRIAAFLEAHPDWRLVPLAPRHGLVAARPEWVSDSTPTLAGAVRLWPHLLRGEGHFIAALERGDGAAPVADDDTVPRRPARPNVRRDARFGPDAVIEQWRGFRRQFLRDGLLDGPVVVRDDRVYLVLAPFGDEPDLHIVRPGLWLGTARPGRFEPSHALALVLLPDDVADFAILDQAEATRYLQGATFHVPGAAGWTLVTVEGWALGWGRRSGDTVKNFYPKGLRWPG